MSTIKILTSHLGLAAVIGMFYVSRLMLAFSRRMSEVTKTRTSFRWFHIGNMLIGIAALGYLFLNNAALTRYPDFILQPTFYLLIFHLPLALGVIINLTATLLYWGWLLIKH